MNILGIDVSKNKLDCILLRPSVSDKELYKKVPNNDKGFQQLIEWTVKKACCSPEDIHAVTESTGPYHIPVTEALHSAGLKVSVVNPARTKNFAGSLGIKAKNDKKDASVIALFGLKMGPSEHQQEPPEYRELQDILKRLEAVEKDIRREKNRLEKNRAAFGSPVVSESVERTISFLKTEENFLKELIDKHINKYPVLKEDRELLMSIPGIGPVLSAWLLVLLRHGDRFKSASQSAAYVGVTPTEHKSGSSVNKRPHMSKCGPGIYRAKLYMSALSAIRCNPDVKDLYERLVDKGKPKMQGIGAAMRKLVHIAFGVIKNQTPYQPQIAK